MSEDKTQLFKWLFSLTQGQIYGLAAIIGVVINEMHIKGKALGVSVELGSSDRLFWFFCVLGAVGTALHFYRTWLEGRQEDRRATTRPETPISPQSKKFAAQITKPITIVEAKDLPPLSEDSSKTKSRLMDVIARVRLREASHGHEIYYQDGYYHNRNAEVTVVQ